MFKFKFIRRKHKETAEEREFVEREVKKIPTAISIIFFVYIVIFLSAMIWYFDFKATYYVSVVEGGSMQPTINSGIADRSSNSEDFVYVNTRKTGERGDIIIIQDDTSQKPIIKRIIGKEGDKVSIFVSSDGNYHVSIKYAWSEEPEVLQEEYVKSYDLWTKSTFSSYFTKKIDGGVTYENAFYYQFINDGEGYKENISVIDGVYYYEVPSDCYFCLGDNRAVSSDSRMRGVFKKEQIKGVADIIVKGGSLSSGNLGLKKFSAIFSFYWGKIEELFSR